MGGVQTNLTNISQGVMTDILNQSAATCSASCSQNQSGNVIIIDGGSVGGDVGFSQNCKVTAACTMTQSLDSQVSSIISAVSDQSNTALTGFMGDLSFNAATNSANIQSQIKNYITNITESTCNSTAVMNQSNNLIYASNSNIKGFVGFQIGGNGQPVTVESSCTMSNLSKITVYNEEQATSKQSNVSISSLALIGLALVLFIFMIIIIVVMGAVKKGGGKKGGGKTVINTK